MKKMIFAFLALAATVPVYADNKVDLGSLVYHAFNTMKQLETTIKQLDGAIEQARITARANIDQIKNHRSTADIVQGANNLDTLLDQLQRMAQPLQTQK